MERFLPSSVLLPILCFALSAGGPGGARDLHAQGDPVERIALPEPWGQHPVGVREFVVVDSSRSVETEDGRRIPRPLLVRAWYPAADGEDVGPIRAYMHPEVAEAWRATLPAPAGWERAVTTHARVGAPVAADSARWPVLLFSHGRSWPVDNYQALAEDLASRGWVVVGISHPGEEALTRLPDGTRLPYSGPQWDSEEERGEVLMSVVDEMTLDASRVLDRLERLDAASSGPFAARLRLADGVAYAGHSLGGAAAAWTLRRDERVVAAASWEGQVYRERDRPLEAAGPLLYIVGGANRAELTGRHFRAGGPERPVFEIVIHGAWHASVGDLLHIYRRHAPRDWHERHRREITPERANRITADYLDAFFGRYLLGRSADLLEPDAPEDPVSDWNYPEVELRMDAEGGGYWSAGADR